MARVLGVLRLSRGREESTSVARQRAYIEAWAEQNGHAVVAWAEDVDVSGSVAPQERPGLGPWLTERSDEWDVLAAWRLDRVTRRVLHLAKLVEWLRIEGKSFVTTSEGFDINSPMGRVFVTIIAALAEGELEAIKERTASSFRHLMKSGRWRGGFTPYGYRPAPSRDGAGWRLEVDPPTADVLREIVRLIVDEGAAANAVVRWLNETGQPTPLDAQRIRNGGQPGGATWRVGNLLRLLRSQAMLGYAEMTETVSLPGGGTESVTRVVRGPDGLPLQRAEPIIERSRWEALQAALSANSNKRAGNREGGSLLLRIAYCECGEPMYRVRGRSEWYYRCGSRAKTSKACGASAIRAAELEAAVLDTFLGLAGSVPIVERVLVPGQDNSERLADIRRAMSELIEDRSAGLYSSDTGRDTFRMMFTKLEAQEDALRATPSRDDAWLETETGETYGSRWASLDSTQARNRELRRAGIRAVVLDKTRTMETAGLFGNDEPVIGGRVAVQMPPTLIVNRAKG